MTIEDRYIYEQFNNNFLKHRDGSIVIYGTGIHTKRLLENIPAQRIAGLMDIAKTGQNIFGKRVLSYEEVAALRDACIVIVARNAVIHVIYRRIETFTAQHGIPVFDINGKRLCLKEIDSREKECFMQKEQKLLDKISQADVVSFDIFDTLLCRRVMYPADVFLLMDGMLTDRSYRFSEERRKAETELPEESNYTIYDIYRIFRKNTGETESETNRILRLEIESEKRVARRREKMCRILEWSLHQEKTVYLISDMYLDGRILEEILKHHGITGYKKLYVSSDYKSSKQEKLFEIIWEQERLKGMKWLHVGDSLFADVYAPKQYGIDTFQIYAVAELLGQGIYSTVIEKSRSLEERMVAGAFASSAYNDPFGNFYRNGKLVVSDAGMAAELLVAPLVWKYITALMTKTRKCKDAQILFPSRDGYLLKKIYDRIAGSGKYEGIPESKYIYTSRRAALVAAAKDTDDIDFILGLSDEKKRGVRWKISRRFGVEVLKDYESEDDIPLRIKEELLDVCREERKNYVEYLKRVGVFDKKSILVDLVAVGTVQDALQRITGSRIYGYYLLRRRPDSHYTRNLCCASLYPTSGDFEPGANVYKYYYFLEAILTSFEPTFMSIGDEGRKNFFDEKRTDSALHQVRKMQDAVFNYCMEIFDLCPDMYAMTAPLDLYEEILGFFDGSLMDIEPSILHNLVNHDELLGKTVTDLNR